MQNTLGISIGTRLLGTAIVHDGELTDFRVRTFAGAWNSDKRTLVVMSIERVVIKYDITKIVVKTPKEYHCSQNITDLTNDVIHLGEEHGIRVMVCTISTILRLNKERHSNKKSLMRSILKRYKHNAQFDAQLTQMYEKEQQKNAPYYAKLFEAIACAEL